MNSRKFISKILCNISNYVDLKIMLRIKYLMNLIELEKDSVVS